MYFLLLFVKYNRCMKHYSKYYKKNNIVSKELNFFLDYNEFFFLKKNYLPNLWRIEIKIIYSGQISIATRVIIPRDEDPSECIIHFRNTVYTRRRNKEEAYFISHWNTVIFPRCQLVRCAELTKMYNRAGLGPVKKQIACVSCEPNWK